MSARDDFGSRSGTSGGYSGGAGGLANGGVGGGMGGGMAGGGAGRNGGTGSRTGMTTGAKWYGNTAYGQPGGVVQAYGMRDPRSLAAAGMSPTPGNYGQFMTPNGQPMYGNSPVQGMTFNSNGMGGALNQAQIAQQGLLNMIAKQQQQQNPSVGPAIEDVPLPPTQWPPQAFPPPQVTPPFVPRMGPWPGQNAIPNNPAVYTPGAVQVGKTNNLAPQPGSNPVGKGDFQGNFGSASSGRRGR